MFKATLHHYPTRSIDSKFALQEVQRSVNGYKKSLAKALLTKDERLIKFVEQWRNQLLLGISETLLAMSVTQWNNSTASTTFSDSLISLTKVDEFVRISQVMEIMNEITFGMYRWENKNYTWADNVFKCKSNCRRSITHLYELARKTGDSTQKDMKRFKNVVRFHMTIEPYIETYKFLNNIDPVKKAAIIQLSEFVKGCLNRGDISNGFKAEGWNTLYERANAKLALINFVEFFFGKRADLKVPSKMVLIIMINAVNYGKDWTVDDSGSVTQYPLQIKQYDQAFLTLQKTPLPTKEKKEVKKLLKLRLKQLYKVISIRIGSEKVSEMETLQKSAAAIEKLQKKL